MTNEQNEQREPFADDSGVMWIVRGRTADGREPSAIVYGPTVADAVSKFARSFACVAVSCEPQTDVIETPIG